MAAELAQRLQATGLESVRTIELTKVFRTFEGEVAMRGFLEDAARREVEVRYLDE